MYDEWQQLVQFSKEQTAKPIWTGSLQAPESTMSGQEIVQAGIGPYEDTAATPKTTCH